MRFDLIFATAIVMSGCGPGTYSPGNDKTGTYSKVDLGEKPTSSASAFSTSAVSSNGAVFLDPIVHAAQQFQLLPLSLQRSFSFPDFNNPKAIFVGDGGNYVIGLSASDFAIQGLGGYQKHPLQMAGTQIESFAFDVQNHILALSDDFESIGVATLSPEGAITGTWIGGPVLTGLNSIGRGGFIGDGYFLADIGQSRVAVIDMRASVATARWQYKLLNLDQVASITFVRGVPGSNGLAMLATDTNVVTVDRETGATVAAYTYAANSVAHHSAFGYPHSLIVQTDLTQPIRILVPSVEGKLEEKTLKSHRTAGALLTLSIEQSHVDLAADRLTLLLSEVHSQGGAQTASRLVLRYRMSDSLILDVSELPKDGDVALANDVIAIRYPSALGLVETRTYGRDPQIQRLERFNLGVLKR